MSDVPFPPMKRPLVAILRGVKPEETADIVDVLIESGMTAIEIPLNSPDPFRSIEIAVKKASAGILVGAGTVLTLEAVDRLHDVGGRLHGDAECRRRHHCPRPRPRHGHDARRVYADGGAARRQGGRFQPEILSGQRARRRGDHRHSRRSSRRPDDRCRGRRLRQEFCGLHQGRHCCVRPRQQPLQARHDGGGSGRARQGDDRRLRSGDPTRERQFPRRLPRRRCWSPPSPHANENSMLVYIQVLRLLAAVAVVAFHAWGVAPDGFKVPESAISFVLSHGGHGVDLFFVISGFIIFYATHRATLTPARISAPPRRAHRAAIFPRDLCRHRSGRHASRHVRHRGMVHAPPHPQIAGVHRIHRW